jgi:hypothetical protein
MSKELVVCETATSTWHYHLRVVGREGKKMGGGAGDSLCEKKMGWDTEIPLESYGIRGGSPGHWCKKCLELAIERGHIVPTAAQKTLLRCL